MLQTNSNTIYNYKLFTSILKHIILYGEDAREIERQSLQNNYQTSDDIRFRMLGRYEERREQTKFSRNEDVEMGKREDQVGSHQK